MIIQGWTFAGPLRLQTHDNPEWMGRPCNNGTPLAITTTRPLVSSRSCTRCSPFPGAGAYSAAYLYACLPRLRAAARAAMAALTRQPCTLFSARAASACWPLWCRAVASRTSRSSLLVVCRVQEPTMMVRLCDGVSKGHQLSVSLNPNGNWQSVLPTLRSTSSSSTICPYWTTDLPASWSNTYSRSRLGLAVPLGSTGEGDLQAFRDLEMNWSQVFSTIAYYPDDTAEDPLEDMQFGMRNRCSSQ
jgi:hypothetical protein